jgi:putative transposase
MAWPLPFVGMPRPPREDVEGGIHHVFARGNRRLEIFLDDDDYSHYLSLLGGVVVGKRWRLLAYCLMPNHVHLLVETPEPNLARGMQYLHGFYAQDFNGRHGVSGHLFQGRYGSVRIRDDAQFVATLRYVAANPVEGSLGKDERDWPWNSYGPVVDGSAPAWLDAQRLFEHLGVWGGDPRRGYVELVSRGLRGLA